MKSKILEAAAYDTFAFEEAASLKEMNTEDREYLEFLRGEWNENARLIPLITLLADVAEAADEIKAEINRARSKDCIGCLNGNDIPDEELCRACWRIWVKGKCYPLWDIDSTEEKLKALDRLKKELGCL